jgi:hypothetical protein
MKPGPIVYMLMCAFTVVYVYMANARGYVPFTSSATRADTNGAGGPGGAGFHSGTAGYFHK